MAQNKLFSSEKINKEGKKNGNIILGFSWCIYRLEFPTAMVGAVRARKNSFNVKRKNKRLDPLILLHQQKNYKPLIFIN